jgi:hypothetical protein
MDTITTQMPAATEACASCSAPIAPDQRYCLNCGARRGDARVPFMDILGGGGDRSATAATHPAAMVPVADARSQRNLTIVASIGCLLLALGVGVLIGHGGRGSGTPASAPAQVIKVQSGGAAATTTPAGSASAPTAKGKKKGAAANSAKTAAGSKATNNAIKKLDKLTPDQYQKQSQKLPKTVGTGGKPPPKDNKPAAGGGSFQTIG